MAASAPYQSEVRTPSEIRTAKREATGGARKRCVKGKNCSAACIQAGMVCLVEMPESAGIAITKFRDYLQSARNKVIGTTSSPSQLQVLRTPIEVADWLLKEINEVALWGIDENRVDAILKYKPKFITVGIEPGGGAEGAEKLKELIPHLRDLPVVRDPEVLRKKRNNIMDDEMQKANNYKMALELSRYLSGQNPEVFGKGYNMVVTDFMGSGFDVDKWITELEKSGVLQNGVVKDIQRKYQIPEGNKSWAKGNRLLAESAGVGKSGDFMGLLNPSGAWKPMEDYSQFNELFKQAGYTQEQAGPFASQKEWLKYSANAVKDRFHKIVTQAKPEFMYMANAEEGNKALVNIVRNGSNGGEGSFKISTMSRANKPVERDIDYFLYKHPDGTRTVVMAGPHPSALAFGSQESLLRATGEIAKSLRLRGELPTSVSDSKVSIQRLEAPGDRIRRETAKKLAKEAEKEDREERGELAKQEKIAKNIEKQASKIIAELQREGKAERAPKVSQRQTTPVASRSPSQPGKIAQNLVNLPNGSFSADNIWKALDEFNQGKKKKDWVPVFQDILRSIRNEQGGFVTRGPKADEARRRAQEAELLPKSSPSFSERPRQLWAQPSTCWDFRQNQSPRDRPSTLG